MCSHSRNVSCCCCFIPHLPLHLAPRIHTIIFDIQLRRLSPSFTTGTETPDSDP